MEIRKLSRENHQEVLDLFADETPYYYFLINELLDNNYSGEAFRVYGEYEGDQLVSILLNNFGNLTYYAKTLRDVAVYQEILPRLSYFKLSGPSELMAQFLPLVPVKSDTLSYMGVVKNIVAQRRYPQLSVRRISSEGELEMHYDLLQSTQEYNLEVSRDEYVAKELKRLQGSQDRRVYLSVDNKMVCACGTVKESRNSAIVIGVVTHPDYRRRGYGTEVLIGLFESLLEEGKYPYLFYNNPAARRVYKNLGMEEVCQWRVVMVDEESK
ncbi:MAG: GNAT family N-acetyltransferase [Firmicutes bacterium]|nr:GNAT family N-acetyltransferase [Bacillota bacterium]